MEWLENGDNVDIIYLDFAKAFDKCDLGILLHKVRKVGITGKLGRWVHSFLIGRQQYVVIDGKKSKVSKVKSGVPQGTVLGPLLFLIYISDIAENVNAKIKVYVDDTKAKNGIKEEKDVENLQSDLDTMYRWAEINNMKFNGLKFQLMRYGDNKSIKEDTLYFTDNMNNIIERYETLKDLGVIMNESGTWMEHLNHVNKKTRQKMGWVIRTFRNINTSFMKQMYKTLIMPHIDYSSQLWMPIDPTGIYTLEKLQ